MGPMVDDEDESNINIGSKSEVPAEVEAFFEAVASENRENIQK